MTQLRIELENIGDKIVLRIDGKLDASSSPLLEKKLQKLIEEKRTVLLLDFSRIDYLSSAGMRVLLSFSKQLKAKKGQLILFSLTDDVMDVIKMAGFERILKIYNTEQQALHSVP